MNIRKSTISDLDDILAIYEHARNEMIKNGNPTQWGKDKPTLKEIKEDIKNENSYVILEGGNIVGVFALLLGIDETYKVIEGSWLNEEEYGAIHRVASNGKTKGILKACLDFCESKIDNIKIDTHKDNKIMQHLLSKYGYKICGTIYATDGTPRIAYQKSMNN